MCCMCDCLFNSAIQKLCWSECQRKGPRSTQDELKSSEKEIEEERTAKNGGKKVTRPETLPQTKLRYLHKDMPVQTVGIPDKLHKHIVLLAFSSGRVSFAGWRGEAPPAPARWHTRSATLMAKRMSSAALQAFIRSLQHFSLASITDTSGNVNGADEQNGDRKTRYTLVAHGKIGRKKPMQIVHISAGEAIPRDTRRKKACRKTRHTEQYDADAILCR